MGSNSIRRLVSQECRWSDKSAERHKHDYAVECCLELHKPRGLVFYYHIRKCSECNSFKCVSSVNNVTGFLSEPISGLPRIKAKSSHYALGFSDMSIIKEEVL